MRAVNLFLHHTENLGEAASSPRPYLQGRIVKPVHLNPDSFDRRILEDLTDQLVIVGGGGLFRPPYQGIVEAICRSHSLRRTQGGKLVIWGAGLDHYDRDTNDEYPIWIKHADLVGVRDWRKGPQWIPCASCLSPEFDKPREIDRPLVVYEHHDRQIPVTWKGMVARTSSFRTMREALDFLGRGEVVLTNSYHGAYWATLLGRKVVCWPWSSRFYLMKHPPVLANEQSDPGQVITNAISYPKALEECRSVNRWFRKRVYDLASDLP